MQAIEPPFYTLFFMVLNYGMVRVRFLVLRAEKTDTEAMYCSAEGEICQQRKPCKEEKHHQKWI